MLKSVNHNGERYPILFGTAALSDFSEITGLSLQELVTLESAVRLDHSIKLAWAGLKQGARKAKKEFSLTWEDVADMVDEDEAFLAEAMAAFKASVESKPAKSKAAKGKQAKKKEN